MILLSEAVGTITTVFHRYCERLHDLIGGTKNSHIATLVERHSRFTMLVKVSSKDTATVVATLSRHVRKLPASLRRSLTWDRGLEMAQHKSFTVDTKVKVYFCESKKNFGF